MITKLDTSSIAPSGSKSSNLLPIVIIAGIAGYLLWKFVVQPKLDKTKKENEQ